MFLGGLNPGTARYFRCGISSPSIGCQQTEPLFFQVPQKMETGNWNRKSSEFLNPRKTSSLPPDPPRRRLTEPRSEHAGPTRSPVKDHADESSYVRGAERRDCHRDPGGNVRPNQEKRRAYSGQLSTGRMPCLLPRIPPRRGTRPQGRAVSFPYATPHVTTLMGRINKPGGKGGGR